MPFLLIRSLSLCLPDFDGLLGVLDGDVVLAELVDPLEVGEVQLDEFFRLIPGYTKEGLVGKQQLYLRDFLCFLEISQIANNR